jgi:hypothetical protein
MTTPTRAASRTSARDKIERPDHQRRHDHGRDERAGRKAGAQHRIAQHRATDQRRCGAPLEAHEQAGADDAGEQQRNVRWAEVAAPKRHGERISGERQREHERADAVEARPIRLRLPPIERQRAQREKQRHEAERDLDQEDRAPAEFGDQHAAERGAERGADRRHRSEQSHDTACPLLRDDLAGQRHGERHHDRRAETLCGARGNQQPQRGREAA